MKNKLKEAMRAAMKAKDKLRLETIRGILSAIQYEEIRKKVDDLSDDGVLAILKNEAKKRAEALEYAEKDNRTEMKQQLLAEIAVVEEFLPQQLSEAEIEKIFSEIKQSSDQVNMGMAMKQLKEQYLGRYDGKAASQIAKRVFG